MAKGDPRNPGGAGFFPAIYQSALAQSAEDYDSILGQYKALGDKVSAGGNDNFGGEKVNYSPITPSFVDDTGGADLSQLREFSQTGGFGSGDIDSIRERSIAPIRSIYDSANRNLLRQKNLSGGYAPNFGAVSAKLARDAGSLIGAQTTAANANVAEMIQRGKLSSATSLAPLEAAEASRKQALAEENARIANQTAMFNNQNQLETARHNESIDTTDFNKILETIKGQQSTFGTTPALFSTVGNQTMQAANVVNNLPPVTRGSMAAPAPYRTNQLQPFVAGRGRSR